jgi:hypothetical protein
MILVAAAFGGFWWLMQRRITESEWRVLPMTSLPSLEQQPAFAPLAGPGCVHVGRRWLGNHDIYLQQRGCEEARSDAHAHRVWR